MNGLGEESRIPVLNVEEGDVGVLLGLPIAGLFVAGLTGVDALLVPLALAGVFFGVTIVYAAPAQLTAWAWLRDVSRFYFRRPRVTHAHPPESEHDLTEGGFVQYTPFVPEERTQDLTGVERAWPGADAIERRDGRMEAFIEVHPANMDFAMSGDWQAVQEQAQQFANTELDFSLTLHATTRSFPVERLVSRLDDRLDDSDVSENPAFEALLREYREQRPAELAQTRQVHYYLGVEVGPLEVYDRFEQERTPGEKLTDFPVLGVLFQPFVTRREDFGDAEMRAAMFDRLDSRLDTVQSELVEKVPGWSATRLDTLELFCLTLDFWNGEEHDPERAASVLATEPVLDNRTREEGE
jgi:hypothetical protein